MSSAILTVHHFIDKVLHLIQSAKLKDGLISGHGCTKDSCSASVVKHPPLLFQSNSGRIKYIRWQKLPPFIFRVVNTNLNATDASQEYALPNQPN